MNVCNEVFCMLDTWYKWHSCGFDLWRKCNWVGNLAIPWSTVIDQLYSKETETWMLNGRTKSTASRESAEIYANSRKELGRWLPIFLINNVISHSIECRNNGGASRIEKLGRFSTCERVVRALDCRASNVRSKTAHLEYEQTRRSILVADIFAEFARHQLLRARRPAMVTLRF